MEFEINRIEEEIFKDMLVELRAKEKYIRSRGIKIYPACFDIGDEVGVYIHGPQPNHKIGRIASVNHSKGLARIKTEDEILTKVSLFHLFALHPIRS